MQKVMGFEQYDYRMTHLSISAHVIFLPYINTPVR